MARKPEPVDADEVKDAVLRMLVERLDGRPLRWEDATMGLELVAFEIKQMALFAPPGNTQPSVRNRRNIRYISYAIAQSL